MWTDYPEFANFAEKNWVQEQRAECGLVNLAWKLKRVKSALRTLNIEMFGRVENRVHSLEERIETLEDVLQGNYSDEANIKLNSTSFELDCWLKREEMRLLR